jgi:DNA-binding response OmpR family regulator
VRVLVAGDDRRVASFIEAGMKQESYAVDVPYDGNEAAGQAATVRRSWTLG